MEALVFPRWRLAVPAMSFPPRRTRSFPCTIHASTKLADLLLDHSCRIEKGEKVLIEAFDLPEPTLVCRLVEGRGRARGRAARVVEDRTPCCGRSTRRRPRRA